jgi:hypothetical protein
MVTVGTGERAPVVAQRRHPGEFRMEPADGSPVNANRRPELRPACLRSPGTAATTGMAP